MLELEIKKKLPFFDLQGRMTVDKEIAVLLGPSGGGKTTLLKVIAGLLKAEQGYIRLNNQEMYNQQKGIFLPPQKRGIGFVFQNFALFPHLTVRKNLAYSKKADEEDIKRWLSSFGIAHLADRYPKELSGGEQQRVALARTLLSDPGLLLMDEPFNSLDKGTKSSLRQELKDVQKQWGIPFIIVTHDEDDGVFLADKTYYMKSGSLSEI
ncbi:MAG: ATP-binding cassette domain-containing protein [Clostridiales bacterium]